MQELVKFFKKNPYTILRYSSITLGLLNAFLIPFVLNKLFSEKEFSFILLLFGYISYLTFIDFGFSKPLYAYIRNKNVLGFNCNNSVQSALFFYGIIFILQLLIYLVFATLLWHFKISELSYLFIVLFSLNVVLATIFVYLKSIFCSIGEFIFIEKIEITQRIINLITVVTLLYSKSLIFSYLISNILLIIILLVTIKFLSERSFLVINKSINYWINNTWILLSKLKKDSINNFIFSINETLIYSNGFLLFPFFLKNIDIIIYGLWMRFFLGIALFMRAVTDINIHAISFNFFNKNINKAKESINISLFLSLLIVIVGFSFYLLMKPFIFNLWVDSKYSFSWILDLSLLIFLIGNSIQHISGTFIGSVGGYFRDLKVYSFYLMTLTLSSILFLSMFFKKLEILLIFNSLIYFTGAIFYMSKMYKILNSKNE